MKRATPIEFWPFSRVDRRSYFLSLAKAEAIAFPAGAGPLLRCCGRLGALPRPVGELSGSLPWLGSSPMRMVSAMRWRC